MVRAIPAARMSLTQQVHAAIRDAIVVGELAPGSLHSIAGLAERLDVSRSPVREALISLVDQGMVAFERNRGVRILETDAHDLEEVFSLRLLLEVPAARRAAQIMAPAEVERLRVALGTVEEFVGAPTPRVRQERDAAFHRVLLDTAGNRRLTRIVDGLRDHQMLSGVSSTGRGREPADIHAEHTLIYERVAAGDAEGAGEAMRAHLVDSARLLLGQDSGGPPLGALLALPWPAPLDGQRVGG